MKMLVGFLLLFSCASPMDMNEPADIENIPLPVMFTSFNGGETKILPHEKIVNDEPLVFSKEIMVPQHSSLHGVVINQKVEYNEKIAEECVRFFPLDKNNLKYEINNLTDRFAVPETNYKVLLTTTIGTPRGCVSNYSKLDLYTFFPGLDSNKNSSLLKHRASGDVNHYNFSFDTCKGDMKHTQQKYIYHFGVYSDSQGKKFITPVLKIDRQVDC